MIYKFRMAVMVEESFEYTVEADSMEEAEEMALSGETEQEEHIDSIGITNREIMEAEGPL